MDPRFQKTFETDKGLKLHVVPAGKVERTILELAGDPGPLRNLIFVREPEKARKLAAEIGTKTDHMDRVLTLTGTMRGFERDRMVANESFKAFTERERARESCWLVATSAGEVGINISADRLITDLDTLDHLLQRFGRLNRFGETAGVAHLVVAESEEKADDKDPRKKRNRAALDFLRALPTRADGLHDISPRILFGRNLPDDAMSEVPLEAPLHDWHIDVWSQTSLGRHPARPAVHSWLHGKQNDIPETYVAWRGDVALLASDSIDPEDRDEVLRKYRLQAHEQLREPTTKLLEKLEELATKSNRNTKFLLRRSDGSVTVPESGIGMFAQLTTNLQRRLVTDEIAYCQIVLPPGCGRLENGMFSPEVVELSEDSSPQTSQECLYDVSGWSADERRRRAAFKTTQLENGTWSLRSLGYVQDESARLEVIDSDLTLGSLRRFASQRKWRFLLKVPLSPPEDDLESARSALLYFDEAKGSVSAEKRYPLDEHLAHVACYARTLACSTGLIEQLALALEYAGKYHDLGKYEEIWQKAAGNLRPGAAFQPETSVAKSIKPMRGRDLNGFRHELASLRRVEVLLKEQNILPEARELVLHLVAAHHGRARPCFQAKAYDRKQLADSKRVSMECARRFGMLQKRYGPWGLAYLEAVLRAADAQASKDWEDPADA